MKSLPWPTHNSKLWIFFRGDNLITLSRCDLAVLDQQEWNGRPHASRLESRLHHQAQAHRWVREELWLELRIVERWSALALICLGQDWETRQCEALFSAWLKKKVQMIFTRSRFLPYRIPDVRAMMTNKEKCSYTQSIHCFPFWTIKMALFTITDFLKTNITRKSLPRKNLQTQLQFIVLRVQLWDNIEFGIVFV